ncbi:hypothetical protein ZIOFF_033593 [Zingiber officinale]|uniref:Uncharacterized protein n=1 Tax=Zingiber officinale TaxID=94328 RepID=A0A8J5LCC1_ZINOF|nr:hypothetical protein ZIOFF_033593 [Zingiber officinale]
MENNEGFPVSDAPPPASSSALPPSLFEEIVEKLQYESAMENDFLPKYLRNYQENKLKFQAKEAELEAEKKVRKDEQVIQAERMVKLDKKVLEGKPIIEAEKNLKREADKRAREADKREIEADKRVHEAEHRHKLELEAERKTLKAEKRLLKIKRKLNLKVEHQVIVAKRKVENQKHECEWKRKIEARKQVKIICIAVGVVLLRVLLLGRSVASFVVHPSPSLFEETVEKLQYESAMVNDFLPEYLRNYQELKIKLQAKEAKVEVEKKVHKDEQVIQVERMVKLDKQVFKVDKRVQEAECRHKLEFEAEQKKLKVEKRLLETERKLKLKAEHQVIIAEWKVENQKHKAEWKRKIEVRKHVKIICLAVGVDVLNAPPPASPSAPLPFLFIEIVEKLQYESAMENDSLPKYLRNYQELKLKLQAKEAELEAEKQIRKDEQIIEAERNLKREVDEWARKADKRAIKVVKRVQEAERKKLKAKKRLLETEWKLKLKVEHQVKIICIVVGVVILSLALGMRYNDSSHLVLQIIEAERNLKREADKRAREADKRAIEADKRPPMDNNEAFPVSDAPPPSSSSAPPPSLFEETVEKLQYKSAMVNDFLPKYLRNYQELKLKLQAKEAELEAEKQVCKDEQVIQAKRMVKLDKQVLEGKRIIEVERNLKQKADKRAREADKQAIEADKRVSEAPPPASPSAEPPPLFEEAAEKPQYESTMVNDFLLEYLRNYQELKLKLQAKEAELEAEKLIRKDEQVIQVECMVKLDKQVLEGKLLMEVERNLKQEADKRAHEADKRVIKADKRVQDVERVFKGVGSTVRIEYRLTHPEFYSKELFTYFGFLEELLHVCFQTFGFILLGGVQLHALNVTDLVINAAGGLWYLYAKYQQKREFRARLYSRKS